MNTSGPSSRPRNPYPLALLNHFTVPFRRSTCALLFLADFPEKGQIPRTRKKLCRHCAADGKDCQGLQSHTGGRGNPNPIPEERTRSEERRVGKECRSRWSPYH